MNQNSLGKTNISRIKVESHISSGLKRHLRELKQEIEIKDNEIGRLKKNVRMTRFKELEMEVKTYMDECNRLRILARSVITSKDPLMDPMQKNELDKKFNDQIIIIEQLRGEHSELEGMLHEKEMELIQLKDKIEDNTPGHKSNKRDISVRERRKNEKTLKQKNKEINKVKSEVLALTKSLNNYKAT